MDPITITEDEVAQGYGIDPAAIKERLRELRADAGIPQHEAAKRAGVTKSVLEKYESFSDANRHRIPNTRQLLALANAYGTTTDFILKGSA